MNITLGSLFDGIGGFPYAGTFFGITPIWASEIEPWPIKVTEKHFPNMKHLGDITKINGAEIEPVDIITFGSPCQDLSVAGKREGLAGERSGLFMDAVRIIRQMRTATGGKRPRFAVWENVPGSFSSNKGEDFRAVLEEITEAEIPMPRSGKWATAGMVRTERVDVAWRVLDAQYWGVPQRRRRIFLVADFGGQCAGEILFVEEGLSGDFAESGKAREEAARAVGNGVKTAGGNNVTSTLFAAYGTKWNGNSGAVTGDHFVMGNVGRSYVATGYRMTAFGEYANDDSASTLKTRDYKDATDLIIEPIPIHDQATRYNGKHGDKQDGKGNGFGAGNPGDPMNTLGTTERHAVAYGVGCRNACEDEEKTHTIQAKANSGISLNCTPSVRIDYAVRRLTPLECERLQGYPDWWLDIEGISDSAKYKAIGNSVAIPCVKFVLGGIARVLQI